MTHSSTIECSFTICQVDEVTSLQMWFPVEGNPALVFIHDMPQYESIESEVVATLSENQMKNLIESLNKYYDE